MSVISRFSALPGRPAILAAVLAVALPQARGAVEIVYEEKLDVPIQITVPATIAGKTYTFILDTGCAVECIDPTLGDTVGQYRYTSELASTTPTPKLDLLKSSTLSFLGPTLGADDSLKICDAPQASVGKLGLSPARACLLDLQALREPMGLPIKGIVGPEALKDFALLLDFDHGTLRLAKGAIPLPSGMQSLKLKEEEHHLPLITTEFNGAPTDFLVDTGNSGCICLNHALFTTLAEKGLIDPAMTSDPTQTITGAVALPSGHFAKGELMGIDLAGMPVYDSGEVSSVGMAFLVNFNVVIDFRGGAFCYQPRRATPPISPHKMLGVALKFSGGHNHVFILDPHSAAKECGLQLWDRITRIGPLREPDLNYDSLYQLCIDYAGRSVEVVAERPGAKGPIDTFLSLPELVYVYPPRRSR